jgi:hypothetical protein
MDKEGKRGWMDELSLYKGKEKKKKKLFPLLYHWLKTQKKYIMSLSQ